MVGPRKRSAKRERAVARSLFHDLPADWYWEQNAELRFTKIDSNRRDPVEETLVRRQIGKRRWETGVEIEGGWESHQALLEAHQPFRDVLMWRTFDDGSRRYLSVSGRPMFSRANPFTHH